MSSKEEQKDKVIVQFDNSIGVYQAGERASFNWAYARRLVKSGAAHYDDPDLKPKQIEKIEMDNAEDSGSSKEENVRTHGKSIEQVGVLIDDINDPDELERLWAGEVVNPQHEGGRKGVLKACRERAAEIKAGDE